MDLETYIVCLRLNNQRKKTNLGAMTTQMFKHRKNKREFLQVQKKQKTFHCRPVFLSRLGVRKGTESWETYFFCISFPDPICGSSHN